jgi:hypothetical protein
MSEGIIDFISQRQYNNDSGVFTVDTGALQVPITYSAAFSGGLYKPNYNVSFVRGDNIQILSIGVVIPLDFMLYVDLVNFEPLNVNLYTKIGTTLTPIAEIPSQYIFFQNYELAHGMFLELSLTVTDDFIMVARIQNGAISMLNVPEEYDEEEFYAPVFMKVLHTLPMYGDP